MRGGNEGRRGRKTRERRRMKRQVREGTRERGWGGEKAGSQNTDLQDR